MPQEFLASFAVDIDEGGVNRLQRILETNRELAEKLSAAFTKAREAVEGFFRDAVPDAGGLLFFPQAGAAGEAPAEAGAFPVNLDFAPAAKQLEAFLSTAKKQLRLTADGSGIVSAVSDAISRARSMLAGAGLKLPVQVEAYTPVPGSPQPAAAGNAPGNTGTAAAGTGFPAVLSGISGLLAGAADTAAPQVTQNMTTRNVSAPVSIRVEAASADPEAVGPIRVGFLVFGSTNITLEASIGA